MKLHYFILFALVLLGCKNNTTKDSTSDQTKTEEGIVTMRGEFIYYDGAAVLQTPNNIYGVIHDDQLEKLNQQVRPYKSSDLDMVTVTLKAKRIPKPEGEEGWPFSIKIKEIVKIETPEPKALDLIEQSK
jgi:hypothetical protein